MPSTYRRSDGLRWAVMIAAPHTIVAYVPGTGSCPDYLLIPHIEGAGEIAVLRTSLGVELDFSGSTPYGHSVHGDVGSCARRRAGTVAVIAR